MAHVRPRQTAVAEARRHAQDHGLGDNADVVIINSPENVGWMIAVACDGDKQPLPGIPASSPFHDIVGERAVA